MTDMTAFATKALDLATTFKANVGGIELEPGAYHAELTKPDGPSTGGGVQALQHIRLVPRNDGYLPLHVGNANQAGKTAELKTYEHVDTLHQQRFHRPVDLDKEQYDKFLDAAQKYLESMKMTVTRSAAPPAPAKSAPAAATAGGAGKPSPIVTVLAVIAAAVLIYFLVRK